MQEQFDDFRPTRMLFMGDATLTDGFQLIGFDTVADPSPEELDRTLQTLIDEKQNAFIILDNRLSECGSPILERVRAEGGRIVITEVPPLNAPQQFHCKIDKQVRTLLGYADNDGGCNDG